VAAAATASFDSAPIDSEERRCLRA
jgi:hypothetical protein